MKQHSHKLCAPIRSDHPLGRVMSYPSRRGASFNGKMDRITHAFLLDVFDYNPETGALKWKKSLSNRAKVGSECKCPHKQHLCVRINRTLYLCHRIIWFYVYGEWPQKDIDHINGDGTDNRIANLRLASMVENLRNQKTPKHNTSGIKGVSRCSRTGKWIACLQVDGRQKFVGRFCDKEDARHAIRQARELHHGEFARH